MHLEERSASLERRLWFERRRAVWDNHPSEQRRESSYTRFTSPRSAALADRRVFSGATILDGQTGDTGECGLQSTGGPIEMTAREEELVLEIERLRAKFASCEAAFCAEWARAEAKLRAHTAEEVQAVQQRISEMTLRCEVGEESLAEATRLASEREQHAMELELRADAAEDALRRMLNQESEVKVESARSKAERCAAEPRRVTADESTSLMERLLETTIELDPSTCVPDVANKLPTEPLERFRARFHELGRDVGVQEVVVNTVLSVESGNATRTTEMQVPHTDALVAEGRCEDFSALGLDAKPFDAEAASSMLSSALHDAEICQRLCVEIADHAAECSRSVPGVVSVLQEVLAKHAGSGERLLLPALDALWSLTFERGVADTAIHSGVADQVVAVMRSHTASSGLQASGCGVLLNISVGESSRSRGRGVDADVAAAAVDAVRQHAEDPAVLEQGCQLLYTLARRPEVRSDVLHAGGRDVVKIASALPGSGLEEERVRRWGKWLGETLRA